ncbi:MAG: hypothetical protein HYU67_07870 [Flavobacteriia bacterium]|nr:hypothetical protein [Flavobacteriia bacterium]
MNWFQTFECDNKKKAEQKLFTHKNKGLESNLSIIEVAKLMDILNQNESSKKVNSYQVHIALN